MALNICDAVHVHSLHSSFSSSNQCRSLPLPTYYPQSWPFKSLSAILTIQLFISASPKQSNLILSPPRSSSTTPDFSYKDNPARAQLEALNPLWKISSRHIYVSGWKITAQAVPTFRYQSNTTSRWSAQRLSSLKKVNLKLHTKLHHVECKSCHGYIYNPPKIWRCIWVEHIQDRF